MTGRVWLALIALAAILRLAGLGQAPLSPDEAEATWLAYRVAVGIGPGLPAAPADSGLLFGLQTWLFAMLGAGDALARLGPALGGVALVLVPLAFRPWLGTPGAVAAALLLAVHPGLVEASRTASGETLAALSGTLLLAAMLSGRWRVSAVLAGLLVVSGSTAWTFLPVLLLGVTTGQGAFAEARRPRAGLAVAAIVAGLTASAMLLHPPGVAAVSASLTTWIETVGRPDGTDFARVLTDPWVLFLGLVGSLVAIRGIRPFDRLLLVWGAWALLALLAREGGDLVFLAVGAALFLGRVVESVGERKPTGPWRMGVAAAAAIAVALVVPPWPSVFGPRRSGELPRLVDDIGTLAAHRPEATLQIEIEHRPDPRLAWYLRHHEQVRWMRAAEPRGRPFPLVIARPTTDLTGAGYTGNRYRLGAGQGDRIVWVNTR